MASEFEPGQKVRWACALSGVDSSFCKVGDVGVYVAFEGGAEDGFVHRVRFERGTEVFIDGELEAYSEQPGRDGNFGKRVRITRGAFKDYHGIYLRRDSEWHRIRIDGLNMETPFKQNQFEFVRGVLDTSTLNA